MKPNYLSNAQPVSGRSSDDRSGLSSPACDQPVPPLTHLADHADDGQQRQRHPRCGGEGDRGHRGKETVTIAANVDVGPAMLLPSMS